jgi:hypothetical protein
MVDIVVSMIRKQFFDEFNGWACIELISNLWDKQHCPPGPCFEFELNPRFLLAPPYFHTFTPARDDAWCKQTWRIIADDGTSRQFDFTFSNTQFTSIYISIEPPFRPQAQTLHALSLDPQHPQNCVHLHQRNWSYIPHPTDTERIYKDIIIQIVYANSTPRIVI